MIHQCKQDTAWSVQNGIVHHRCREGPIFHHGKRDQSYINANVAVLYQSKGDKCFIEVERFINAKGTVLYQCKKDQYSINVKGSSESLRQRGSVFHQGKRKQWFIKAKWSMLNQGKGDWCFINVKGSSDPSMQTGQCFIKAKRISVPSR